MILSPESADGGSLYKLLIDVVTPRPIGFVSTISAAGVPNLAPFSFFNMVSATPPICYFSPSISRSGVRKHSHENVLEVPEFVVNVVSEEIAAQMVQASFEYERGVSEFEKTGLTPIPCEAVRPPRVAESPASLECKVIDIREFRDARGGVAMILGEIVRLHVRDDICPDGKRIDPRALKSVGRLGGSWYCRSTDCYEIPRPKSGE